MIIVLCSYRCSWVSSCFPESGHGSPFFVVLVLLFAVSGGFSSMVQASVSVRTSRRLTSTPRADSGESLYILVDCYACIYFQ
jgi:hypothetical protein